MKIISANDNRYVVLGTVSVENVTTLAETPRELKKLYTLADTVLRNGDLYYACMKLIDIKYEDIY